MMFSYANCMGSFDFWANQIILGLWTIVRDIIEVQYHALVTAAVAIAVVSVVVATFASLCPLLQLNLNAVGTFLTCSAPPVSSPLPS